jgi:hypothetical protein
LRILVYEYLSGGGAAREPIPPDVLSEGFGMLRTLISDFKAAGNNVTTFLDKRLAAFNPPLSADNVISASSWQQAKNTIENVSGAFDAAYIIGPETNHTLQSLVETIEQTSLTSLNCPASAIEQVSNKMNLYKRLKQRGISTPKTIMLDVSNKKDAILQLADSQLEFPLIFKPLDGVSCSGSSIVHDKTQVAAAVAQIRKESTDKHVLIQEYVKGTAASVSLIVSNQGVRPISLNKQNLTLSKPGGTSSYDGGLVPFDDPLRQEAFAVAAKAVESFENLKGYVGVDLVLTEKEAVVIEVNPRLTTSYVGLKHTANFNVAQAIAYSVLENRLPEDVQLRGYSCFGKVKTRKPAARILQTTYKIEDLVSPPFPTSTACAYALLQHYGLKMEESVAGLIKARKHLHRTLREG